MSDVGAGLMTGEEIGRQVNEGLSRELSVSEIFGPTFQGEGPSIGTPCYFLRLGGCNQHCSWCDTPYTWAFSDALAAKHQTGKKYNPRDELCNRTGEGIIEDLEALYKKAEHKRPVNLLVISGGEPLLQQKKLIPLMEALAGKGWMFEIETAGTIGPMRELSRIVHRFNVSPKLENSGNPLTQRYKPQALKALQDTGRVAWKFVVVDIEDLKEIDHIVSENKLWPIYVMPEGVSGSAINEHAQTVAQEVLRRGWHMTTRLQILLYGNRRGV
jgi:7-carboxy-7-deazaguanine synthase